MKLSSLLEALGLRRVVGDPEIRAVTRDSREVDATTAFVAVVGGRTDGHDFVAKADAPVSFVERRVEGGLQVVVPDTKAVLASVAAALEGHPGAAFPVVGVTGTNGKTSVTTLAEQAFVHLGHRVGRVGTTGNTIAGKAVPTRFTTPEAPALQHLLAQMRDAEVLAGLLEVSSHGLVQHRVDAIPFHLGVFTNLTQDHLDFHGTMEGYARAKAMLFERLRPEGGLPRALLCADDPAHTRLGAPSDQWTYGSTGDLRIEGLRRGGRGMTFDLHTPLGTIAIDTALVGAHNALNLTAALGIGLTLGLELEPLAEAISLAAGAPGRLERVPGEGPLVLVDYAHSPDALETVLPMVRALAKGRLWVVFGAGGDRDAGKRPLMGRAAEAHADVVVLTSDNPRSEDPEAILDAIEAGMTGAPAARISDRAEAIRFALTEAKDADVVVIAGKGHESTQEIEGVKHPFDDRVIARTALEDR